VSSTVLVTGAGGFVGSAVVRLLARRIRDGRAVFDDGAGIERAVGVLRPGGSRSRLEELEPHPGWSIAEADLTDLEAARELVRSVAPRAVLHLALEQAAHEELTDEERHRLVVAPLEALVEALAESGGRRFVHTGSAWVLAAGDRLDESAPLDPVLPYSRAKAREARRLPEVAGDAGVAWVNLRLFNMFGRYESSSRLLPYLVRRLSRGKPAELADGDLVRDFNDVDNMARAYLLALRAPDAACGRVYHIGSGRGTRVRDFAGMVADAVGDRGDLRFGARTAPDEHLDRLVCDPDLARRRLGWSVPAPLEDRVRRAAEWWLTRTEVRA
jgi:dolichol-phosphate mannosyltransferase